MNVYFHTFGCKANQYDTALVQQAFSDQGVTVVDDPATADLAVVNSCTVTHESEAKLRRLVRRLGREHPAARTVVMGCAAARDDYLERSAPRRRHHGHARRRRARARRAQRQSGGRQPRARHRAHDALAFDER